LRGFGILLRVGVEGTGSYGAALTRYLTAQHVGVIEVNRPDRTARSRSGKSDAIDAYAAAIAVLSGRATATPKDHTGTVEAIRVLHTTRAGVMKARTAAKNTLNNLIVTVLRPTCVTSYAH
jgi:transposase